MTLKKSARTSRRRLLGLAAFIACSVGGLGAAALIEGCSSPTTGGKRVVLHTRVKLDPVSARSFTTGFGWKVTLTRALVATGDFYYFDGAPPLAVHRPRRDWEFAQRWLGLGIAHAHPGHYEAGNALGQMLTPWSVDLLTDTAALADGDGVTGIYRSASFSFKAPPAGPFATELFGHVAIAEGTAEKEGEELRTFRAIADLTDLEDSVANGQVDGCEFAETDVQSDGTVTASVNPKFWFNLVDFSEAKVGSAEEPSEFEAGSQPKIAFAQGVTQLSAYKFSYSKQ